jgi:predicted acyltransferase
MSHSSLLPSPSVLPKRALSLDALRGFAILTMVLSGVIPYGVLPAWMYHAQLPPPTHKFDAGLPGLTWVDLVFPFFIFSMGAAFPLAFSRRLEKGTPHWKILFSIAERGFLLGSFAIFLQHVRPYQINSSPTTATWLLAMLGFALMFLMYGRFPWKWSSWVGWGVKAAGWIGAILFMIWIRYPDGSGFIKGRSDIIIVILTNIAVFGSLVWLLTRSNLLLRLGVLGAIMALRLSGVEAGWIAPIWGNSFMNWILMVGTLSYLFVAIPGTIAGDLLLQWMNAPDAPSDARKQWSKGRYGLIFALMMVFVLLLLIGLQGRHVFVTTLLAAGLSAAGWRLFANPGNSFETLLRKLFGWGVYWLLIGLLFDPYQGGIKKDPATMSYFLVTSGLACFMLVAFAVVIDVFRKQKWMQLLIDNGQNPMIAYTAHGNFLLPLLVMTGLGDLLQKITPTPWLGALRGVFVTLLVALFVSVFTRKKIFWRT